jgi:hypothetical protein
MPTPTDRLGRIIDREEELDGWTDVMLDARAKLIEENVARAARGEPPVNRVA